MEEQEEKKYQKITFLDVQPQKAFEPAYFFKSNLQLDNETRKSLHRMEQWHFLFLQSTWFTVVSFMTSSFAMIIFAFGYVDN